MSAITVTDNPLVCYCGKSTRVYDSLFRRNFCSDECSQALMKFLGGSDKSVEIMKEIRAGDFSIKGSTVTLHETLQAHQRSKATSIDKIDAQIQADQKFKEIYRKVEKLDLDKAGVEAMLKIWKERDAKAKEPKS